MSYRTIHAYFVEECLQHNANFKMAQRCQHGIPDVVLMVLKAFLRRECGRANRPVFKGVIVERKREREKERKERKKKKKGRENEKKGEKKEKEK